MRMPAEAHQRGGGGYFTLINQLRGLAALMVVWDHFVGQWLAQRSIPWGPDALVTRFLLGPLNIIQHMGFLGVALFFFISGFVVARAGAVEAGRAFLVRRALRIYPPLIAAVLLSVAADYARYRLGLGATLWDQIDLKSVLQAMTLATYVSVPQVVIVGVAWTLIIEITYYVLVWAVAPIFRSRVPDLVATAVILAVIFVVVLLDRTLGSNFFLFSVSVSYVPLLVLGQVVFLVTQRGASRIWGAVAAVAAWLLFVWGLERAQPHFLTPVDSYGSSLSVAGALFLVAVLTEGRVRSWRVLDAVAARSYSLYLVHGIVGLLVLDLMWREGIAYRWDLLAALVATAVLTELVYRLVEKPSISLGRRWTRRWRSARPAPAAFESTVAVLDATVSAADEVAVAATVPDGADEGRR